MTCWGTGDELLAYDSMAASHQREVKATAIWIADGRVAAGADLAPGDGADDRGSRSHVEQAALEIEYSFGVPNPEAK